MIHYMFQIIHVVGNNIQLHDKLALLMYSMGGNHYCILLRH